MKTNIISVIKNISFVVLTTISLAVTVYLFTQLSGNPLEQFIFGCLAFAIEGTKIFSLVTGFQNLVAKKYAGFIVRMLVYVFLASLSIFASYGFSLSTVQGTVEVIARTDTVVADYDKQIAQIDQQIETTLKKQADTPYGWIGLHQTLRDDLERLRKEREDLSKRKEDEQKKTETVSTAAKNVFDLIGDNFGIEPKRVKFTMLLLLAFMVEVCIVFTSPKLNILDKKKKLLRKGNMDVKQIGTFRKNRVAPIPEILAKPSPVPQVEVVPVEEPAPEVQLIESKKDRDEAPKKKIVLDNIQSTKPATVIEVSEELSEPQEIGLMKFGGTTKEEKIRFESFVKALFNSGSKSLRDVKDAAEEAGISSEVAIQYFKKLTAARGSKGYPLVEFRNKNYYSYYPLDQILKIMTEVMVD